VALAKNNGMIQAFVTKRPDQTLGNTIFAKALWAISDDRGCPLPSPGW
jgi:hypothetical protein